MDHDLHALWQAVQLSVALICLQNWLIWFNWYDFGCFVDGDGGGGGGVGDWGGEEKMSSRLICCFCFITVSISPCYASLTISSSGSPRRSSSSLIIAWQTHIVGGVSNVGRCGSETIICIILLGKIHKRWCVGQYVVWLSRILILITMVMWSMVWYLVEKRTSQKNLGPAGIRTHDLPLSRRMLLPLSYWNPDGRGARYMWSFLSSVHMRQTVQNWCNLAVLS